MRRDKTSVSQDLKAIWEMLEEQQVPISARLAEELDVTLPAVTAAVKRMARDGHVTVKRGGHILLTPKGRKFAQRLMLRHRLAEMLLTEVIGLSWGQGSRGSRMHGAASPRRICRNLCVYEKQEGFLDFLENPRLRDETMMRRAAGHTLHLGKPATSRIWVRRSA